MDHTQLPLLLLHSYIKLASTEVDKWWSHAPNSNTGRYTPASPIPFLSLSLSVVGIWSQTNLSMLQCWPSKAISKQLSSRPDLVLVSKSPYPGPHHLQLPTWVFTPIIIHQFCFVSSILTYMYVCVLSAFCVRAVLVTIFTVFVLIHLFPWVLKI